MQPICSTTAPTSTQCKNSLATPHCKQHRYTPIYHNANFNKIINKHTHVHKNHETMNVRIKAIHFEIAERLTTFIGKKADRMAHRYPDITDFDVTLTLVKPETALNKEATLRVAQPPYGEIVASKTADTFEEAFTLALEALDRQLDRRRPQR